MESKLFFEIMNNDAKLVTRELEKLFLSYPKEELSALCDAEKYSLMAGGKRIRPVIAFSFCRMHGIDAMPALPYACALEMIHTASLIHDDLPCIDNDDLRRGRPTNHKVYGESTALLAGDGLLMDAFGVAASNEMLSPKTNLQAVKYLSECVGTRGLVGGEFIDILGESAKFSLKTLEKMNRLKTGALIRASAVLGTLAAGVSISDAKIKDAEIYADSIGLAFQIIDDILDVTGSAEELGKNPGQDEKDNKTTYLSFYSVEEAYNVAKALTDTAIGAVSKYEGSEFLISLAEYLLERRN